MDGIWEEMMIAAINAIGIPRKYPRFSLTFIKKKPIAERGKYQFFFRFATIADFRRSGSFAINKLLIFMTFPQTFFRIDVKSGVSPFFELIIAHQPLAVQPKKSIPCQHRRKSKKDVLIDTLKNF